MPQAVLSVLPLKIEGIPGIVAPIASPLFNPNLARYQIEGAVKLK